MKSLYSVLGVGPQSTTKEIERAYKKMALQHHPDRPAGSGEEFREILNAYEVLIDSAARKQYDEQYPKQLPRRPTRRDELKQVKEHYQVVIEQLEGQMAELRETYEAALTRASQEILELAAQLQHERKSHRQELITQTETLVRSVANANMEVAETRRNYLRELDEALQTQFEMLTKKKLVV